MISNKIVLGDENSNDAVIILPGRGGAGSTIGILYNREVLQGSSLIVGLTPHNYEWYPKPKGPKNQTNAIEGLPKAVDAVMNEIYDIERIYRIPMERITVAGFSAGGVVALATSFVAPALRGVIVHSGAILEPANVPTCTKPNMPYLLTHSRDDNVFTWSERYEPMVEALRSKGYKVQTSERDVGGHCMSKQDLKAASDFFAKF